MAKTKHEELISPPLMFAFRHAHAERGAKVPLDLKAHGHGRTYANSERKLIAQRNAARLAVTVGLLRHEVGTDIEKLMNTISMESSEDLQPFDHVRRSILNYGCPDIVHRTIDEFGVRDIINEIKEALTIYEPRLVPGSIRVGRDENAKAAELKVRFVVGAQLRWNPVNVSIEFLADVEVESGKIALSRV